MAAPLFSASWYRVADLRPRLRSHAKIHRHVYRGRPWYVIQDLTSQKFHRFSPATHALLGLMDGERTLHEIWQLASAELADDAPTQDETIRLLAQLHLADLLQSDVPADTAELLARFQQRGRREFWGRLINPFAIRIPLLDPERLLVRLLPLVRPLLGRAGALLWLAVVGSAILLAITHWTQLSEDFVDRVLSAQNLLLIWLIFPPLKALHELGHGFVARRYGAEVHDMGLMLLVFTPIPYVDASSASALPERGRRALVGAAGMLVEGFIAALAMFVWVNAEPGVVRSLAYNAMLIGAVATIGFNANPLLRFDGYYILADLLEIPNLRARANAYLGHLFQRHALGRLDAEPPDTTPGEPAWLLGFAVASFVYRVIIVAAIFLFVLDISLVLGAFLVALSLVGWVVLPVFKMARYLLTDPGLRDVRTRALGVVIGGSAALLLLVAVLPVPYRTQSEGVVWIPDEALVRAATEGFVERLLAEPGQWVQAGDPLVECSDPALEAQAKIYSARLRGLNARYHRQLVNDRSNAAIVDEEREHVRRRLLDVRERLAELVIHAGTDGVFVSGMAEDLPGRFVRQGEALAYVLDLDPVTVRAVVSQDDVDLVREAGDQAEVRLSERVDEVLSARIVRVVPTASPRLPSTALGSAGGGEVAIDPRDERGTSAVQKHFVVELELPEEAQVQNLGGRVFVRFDHGARPLAVQWYRSLRQLFLSRLDV